VPGESRISLARARQLEQAGVHSLAERQLLHAVSVAPRWPEAQRELARFYTRRARWKEAAASWRNVLFLARTDVEARAQFDRANRMVSALRPAPSFARNIVEMGQNSGSTLSSAGSFYTREAARTTPRAATPLTTPTRLAQSDVASSTPNSMTGGDATIVLETPSTTSNGATTDGTTSSRTPTSSEPPLPPPNISLGSSTTVGRRPVPLSPATTTQRAAATRATTPRTATSRAATPKAAPRATTPRSTTPTGNTRTITSSAATRSAQPAPRSQTVRGACFGG
jgi:hypothetical protein